MNEKRDYDLAEAGLLVAAVVGAVVLANKLLELWDVGFESGWLGCLSVWFGCLLYELVGYLS